MTRRPGCVANRVRPLSRAQPDAKPATGIDAQIAADLNTMTVASEAAVSGSDVSKLWARRGVLGAAREANRGALTPGQRATAWNAIEMVDRDRFSGLDQKPVQRAALVSFLDGLVAETIMNAGDKGGDVGAADAFADDRTVIGMAAGPWCD